MCGIVGVVGREDKCALEVDIVAMNSTLVHRGPDAMGFWTDPDVGVALGHRRLAIVELSERGAQPMQSACGRYVLSFNGEIYNHLEMREELQAKGQIDWRGFSDTETLLAGFVAWGVEATLQKTVGMFAIGLWDRARRELTLARDRFGEKPLYYGWLGSGNKSVFVFGSELKALRAHSKFDNQIDRNALALFLRYSYVPAPYSIMKNIYKLEPGSILTAKEEICTERKYKIIKYWDSYQKMINIPEYHNIDDKEAISKLEDVLDRAVRGQITADVPVGAFLSGGVDSSLIVALMQKNSSRSVKTFTVSFDESSFNEAPFASAVAQHLGTDHHEIRVSPKETLELIPNMPFYYDEPFADSSQLPTSIICRMARQNVKVALTGDAGDELFGGYDRYLYGPQFWNLIKWMPYELRKLAGAALVKCSPEQWNRLGRLPPFRNRFSLLGDKVHKAAARLDTVRGINDVFLSMMTQWPPGQDPAMSAAVMPTLLDDATYGHDIHEFASRMMIIDSVSYLPDDILTKVDRAAMSTGLEARVPMLDHRVAEVAWSLPTSMKIRNGVTKWALRQVLYRYVPIELIERPKAGFGIPVGAWLRDPLREWAEELFSERRLLREGFLDASQVSQLWREHLSGSRDWTSRLWNIAMFQCWYSAWNE